MKRRLKKKRDRLVFFEKEEDLKLKRYISSIYNNQKQTSKKRGHNPPEYSRREFLDWFLSQENISKIKEDWISSGFKKEFAPSADRIDNSKGYSFDNIQLVTLKENYENLYIDVRLGKFKNRSKPVLQFDLEGNFIKEYFSSSDAARKLNLNRRAILNCCNKVCKTSGGYKWVFKEYLQKLCT